METNDVKPSFSAFDRVLHSTKQESLENSGIPPCCFFLFFCVLLSFSRFYNGFSVKYEVSISFDDKIAI